MDADRLTEDGFRIAPFDVRPLSLEIAGPSGTQRLQRRVMAVLVALAARQGGVLTRDDLIRDVWEGRSVTDDAVNRCIAELRRVLEREGSPPPIETIPRVGYRLLLPVELRDPGDRRREDDGDTAPAAPPSAGASGAPTLPRSAGVAAGGATVEADPRRRWRLIAAGVAAVAVLGLAWALAARDPGLAGPGTPRRLAVLPLDDLGDDPGFAGGLHDTLINELARIQGLTLIARSSVLQYEGTRPTIDRVARDLDVDVVLEGSVQRSDGRLRINVQLVDAATGVHLWADTFHRSAEDVFAVQQDIAAAVSEELRLRLAPAERGTVVTRLTSSSRAYEHYMVARYQLQRLAYGEAIRELQAAVALDPAFMSAHAALGRAYTLRARFERDPAKRAEDLSRARDAVDRALRLSPDAPDAHFARGVYLYTGLYSVALAEPHLVRAAKDLPNDAAVLATLGYLRRRQGRIDEAIALFERAVRIDPRGPVGYDLPRTLALLGREQQSAAWAKLALLAKPGDPSLLLLPAQAAIWNSCDPQRVRDLLAALPPTVALDPRAVDLEWRAAMQAGRYEDALAAARRRADGADEQIALALLALDRRAEARPHLIALREAAEHQLAQPERPATLVADSLAALSLASAMLGDADAARRHAGRALGLIDRREDAVAWRDLNVRIAQTYAVLDDVPAALAAVERAVGGPLKYPANALWCGHELAPLRGNAELRALLARHGARIDIDPRDASGG